MTLPKPDKIAAGQWWQYFSATPRRVHADEDVVRLQWYTESANVIYLGCGEHPEPSEWMTETLAEHGCAVLGDHTEPWPELDVGRHDYYRNSARNALAGKHSGLSPFTRSVLSLYRILRELGKW